MIVFDLFAGTGSSTKAFEQAGHRVVKIELDTQFEADERDVMQMTGQYLKQKYGQPDFIWASPPCTTFSVASIGRHWNKNRTPKSQQALEALQLVSHTINLIKELNPKYWIIENPRGMLRKQSIMQNLPRQTVTYCQYNDFRMKPTDLWGKVGNWVARKPCKNGDKCHQSAPRGSRNGTQGIKGAKDRSVIPFELSKEIYKFTLE